MPMINKTESVEKSDCEGQRFRGWKSGEYSPAVKLGKKDGNM